MDFAGDGRNDALADGRRIYLGAATCSQPSCNLHYELKSEDIEEFLISNGFDDIENIQISVDAVSGRNPGYCFVDFSQRATADRALNELRASLRGRELKVGPCEPRKKRTGDGRQGFQRSNDWRGQSGDDGQQFQGGEARDNRPRGFTRSDEVVDESQGKRLYVGGLAKMGDPEQNTQEIIDIFTGFNPSNIGKRIAPHESARSPAGTYYYCFVDFETKEEAEAAMQALDGAQYDGGLLKVSLAKRTERQFNRPNATSDRNGGQGRGWRSNNMQTRTEGGAAAARAMGSNNWRKRDGE
ncbi:hypothetical protein BBK36DRAFT_1201981 [Trichoderma citrinoviride]|uniref:RRM domain-containing protein n=1 Tax=Trichoderma citrinoviride TaxID=58853 RepID=A0A2T4B883_9HYPO|nr:hypothetical protein BBK36DRAFT_1201981 [Trichoderma citrinoviride]PTB65532.1 hypothetical protein BBK36DRAFT_1201981 [Trichoderma citrinoviride]